jgi:hypothetical protein
MRQAKDTVFLQNVQREGSKQRRSSGKQADLSQSLHQPGDRGRTCKVKTDCCNDNDETYKNETQYCDSPTQKKLEQKGAKQKGSKETGNQKEPRNLNNQWRLQ